MKTRLFIFVFGLCTAQLVACSRPIAGDILKEAEALCDSGLYDSAAFLLEEKVIPTSLADSDKAVYGYLLAIVHANQGRSLINDSTLLHFTLQYDKEHDLSHLFTTYELLADYNSSVGQPQKNEALLKEAIAEAEARKDTSTVASFYHRLGYHYYNVRDYQQVITCSHKLASISEWDKASAWYLLGLNYGRMEMEDSASWYMSHAASLACELQHDRAYHYARNYADHISSSDPGKALEYLRYLKTLYPDKDFFETYANAYIHLGQKDSADYYLTKAEAEASSNDPWYITWRVNLMALRMVWQVQHHLPYELSTIGQFCDSASFASLRMIKMEKERAFAQNKLILDNARIEAERQRVMMFFFIFLFLFVLVGSIVFFYIRNRRDKLLEAEEKLESLQQLLREAAATEHSMDNAAPDSHFFRKILLQQLGIIRLMATAPTEQNQELLQQMSRLANDNVPADTLLVWDDLYPLIDVVYEHFYTRLVEYAADRLSEKEMQLCCLLCAGFSTKEISVVTRQSVRTIYQRKTNIRHALGMDEKDDIVDCINRKSRDINFSSEV